MNQPRNGDQDAGRAADALWSACKSLSRACELLAKDHDRSDEGQKVLKHLMGLMAIKDKLSGQRLLFGPTSPMSRKPKKRSGGRTRTPEALPQELEPEHGLH